MTFIFLCLNMGAAMDVGKMGDIRLRKWVECGRERQRGEDRLTAAGNLGKNTYPAELGKPPKEFIP